MQLKGQTVFLSASAPAEERAAKYRRAPDARFRIDEAVVSVARAVFSEGGNLAFGAHPSITPLVAFVVSEYQASDPRKAIEKNDYVRPLVIMYQSRVWEALWAPRNQALAKSPCVRLTWTDSAEGEEVSNYGRADRPQAPASLLAMRRQMIRECNPLCMVAIGGMEGVEDEAEVFFEIYPRRPVFVFASTGGAAELLAENSKKSNAMPTVHVVDADIQSEMEAFWAEQKVRPKMPSGKNESAYYIPYGYLAQKMVRMLRIT